VDTTKWKSILVPRETYEEVVEVAKMEGRTISGQLRIVFSQWKEDRRIEAESLEDGFA
jgi:hypothetical protein